MTTWCCSKSGDPPCLCIQKKCVRRVYNSSPVLIISWYMTMEIPLLWYEPPDTALSVKREKRKYGKVPFQPRDRHVPPPPDSKPWRRRDDDNDDVRRGRREGCSDNWASSLFQSLPCDPGQTRERERSESRHRRRDKSLAPDGRRRNIQRSSSPGPDGIEGQGRLNSPSPSRRARSNSCMGRTQPTPTDPAHPHHPASMDAGGPPVPGVGGEDNDAPPVQEPTFGSEQTGPTQEAATPLGAPLDSSSGRRGRTREHQSGQHSNGRDNDSRSPPPVS